MNNARQETVADIVAEMRIGDLCAADTTASRPEYINDFLTSYADRIEAAWKREQEAGAEAAQICGKIGEIVGREATTEKSSAVGNADIVREVAQEMLNTSMQDITAEVVYGWASRLADACKQSVTDCNQLGNTAKMREALEQAKRVLHCAIVSDILKGEDARKAFNAVTAALSAQQRQRNCDVGTPEEQSARFDAQCRKYMGCLACPFRSKYGGVHNLCEFVWSQMPYEEGETNEICHLL